MPNQPEAPQPVLTYEVGDPTPLPYEITEDYTDLPVSAIARLVRETVAAGRKPVSVRIPREKPSDALPTEPLAFYGGKIEIGPPREVKVNGQVREASPKVYALITLLARSVGGVVTRDQIRAELWPDIDPQYISERQVTINVNRAREFLKPLGHKAITTTRGLGFRPER